MTASNARTAANVVVASGCVAAAYVIVTTPRLRRLALLAIRVWIGTSVPAYLAGEIRQAWLESGKAA